MANLLHRLLDAARDALDCVNDSELADALGVGAARISNYRKGRSLPNPVMARHLARVVKLPPGVVVAAMRRQKELRRSDLVRQAARQVRKESARLRDEARWLIARAPRRPGWLCS